MASDVLGTDWAQSAAGRKSIVEESEGYRVSFLVYGPKGPMEADTDHPIAIHLKMAEVDNKN